MTLRPYQIAGRDFLAARRHALLADEMRVGKTPQAILAASEAGCHRILVVCPAIGVAHWEAEFRKWWPGAVPPRVTIRSYDRAKMERVTLTTTRWDLTIVDECHYAKNPEAQRTKLIYGKSGLGWASHRLWVLSGTPATKHAGELWPMLRAFGVVGMDYDQFTDYYCARNPHTLKIVGTKSKRIPEIRELLGKVMLRRTRKDVAPEMPGISFEFLEVKPTGDADLSVPASLVTDKELAAWVEAHPSADREDRMAVAQAKVAPLAEEVAGAIRTRVIEQTVVFGWHIEPLKSLAMLLGRHGLKVDLITGATTPNQRQKTQDLFQEGRVQVVVANILAAGTSVSFSAARHGYFLELDWLPANNAQAANRLVSMDKMDPVTFDVCTAPGTVDDKVQRILLRRSQELSRMF